MFVLFVLLTEWMFLGFVWTQSLSHSSVYWNSWGHSHQRHPTEHRSTIDSSGNGERCQGPQICRWFYHLITDRCLH